MPLVSLSGQHSPPAREVLYLASRKRHSGSYPYPTGTIEVKLELRTKTNEEKMVRINTKSAPMLLCMCVLLTAAPSAFSAYGDMDPGTCAPSGVINKAKERMDPKGFWVRMFLDSAQGIMTLTGQSTDQQWSGPQAQCLISNAPGSQGYTRCMLQMQNMLGYWVKCHRHAATMCRLHGGNC